MASNETNSNPKPVGNDIPLEEVKPLTATTDEINSPTDYANTNAHENIGVDDGLLDDDNTGSTNPNPRPAGPEVIEPGEVDAEEPGISGGRHPLPRGPVPTPGPRPEFPRKPEEPMYPPDPRINNGINYMTKKNIAQGMMDIALLTANASQLRYVMRSPYWDIYHQANIVLISISIGLQIIAGIMLVFISRYDFKRKEDRGIVQTMNDIVVIFIFAITVVNIFIAAFGVDDERTTFLRWKQSADSSTEPLMPLIRGTVNITNEYRP